MRAAVNLVLDVCCHLVSQVRQQGIHHIRCAVAHRLDRLVPAVWHVVRQQSTQHKSIALQLRHS